VSSKGQCWEVSFNNSRQPFLRRILRVRLGFPSSHGSLWLNLRLKSVSTSKQQLVFSPLGQPARAVNGPKRYPEPSEKPYTKLHGSIALSFSVSFAFQHVAIKQPEIRCAQTRAGAEICSSKLASGSSWMESNVSS